MERIAQGRIRQQAGLWDSYGKRGMDLLVSALGLLILWPWMLLVMGIIVLDSPGAPPVFVQTRVGRMGVPFRLYKFRTMVPDAEEKLGELLGKNEMDGPVFKLREDPRITGFGRLLRRSGLDELPQLWNVLRGEMSLVGPRPGLPREAAQYTPYQRQRLAVKPGITCYWQIQPQRNSLSFEKWMELDMQYLQDMGFATDVKILLATAKALLRMDGQ